MSHCCHGNAHSLQYVVERQDNKAMLIHCYEGGHETQAPGCCLLF